jgi:hypothetical protein
MVIVQVSPLQAPPQPVKTEPATGAALRVTLVPEVKLAEQAPMQLMPEGDDVTVPLPVPAALTERAYTGRKFAVSVAPCTGIAALSGFAVIVPSCPDQLTKA